jgi:hypothetical protein
MGVVHVKEFRVPATQGVTSDHGRIEVYTIIHGATGCGDRTRGEGGERRGVGSNDDGRVDVIKMKIEVEWWWW